MFTLRIANMSKVIIHSVKLFDGEGIHENATVVFDQASGTIDSVLTGSGAPEATADAELVDGSGMTLMPGLIEGHMHCWDIHMPEGIGNSDVLRMTMRAGVTTVCDFHSDPYCVENLRDLIKKENSAAKAKGKDGRVHMADLKTALLAATIQGGWPKPVVLSHHHTDPARVCA
jgi:dihydroorotase-like cyclic amidohydrolase